MFKVLIVDDEPIIRQGIMEAITRHLPEFQVFSAKDGDEALTVALNVMPDLVITDIQMPEYNGLDFIEQLKAESPDVYIIILSGYDDFGYAQRGLQLGVVDYLLKPLESQAIVERVQKAALEIEQRYSLLKNKEELQLLVNESLPLYRERLYRKWVSGDIQSPALETQAAIIGIACKSSAYLVAVLKVRREDGEHDQMNEALVTAAVNEIMSGSSSLAECYPFFEKEGQLTMIIGGNERKHLFFQTVQQSLVRLAKSLQQMSLRIQIGLGAIADSVDGVHTSYMQAVEAVSYTFSSQDRILINYEEIGTGEVPKANEVDALFEQFLLLVKLYEKEQALEQLQLVFRYYEKNDQANPHWVKLAVMNHTMAFIRLMEQCGIPAGWFFQDKATDPYWNLYRHEHFQEMKVWFTELLTLCFKEMEKSRATKMVSYIDKAKVYIESAYADSSLSLGDLAAKLFINPNYLRQLFRQQMKESFVEYLTKVRMEKAAELLRDHSLKIQEIAEKVGYEEQRYFSSCFKKYFQLTPTEYREADNLQNPYITSKDI
ncbi:hypothetical protein A8709_28240 [Paenibacillus pectinilyticus]|uniref:DNA-binding response regulator n=1 Tax=Paenibacillus pectinilyticus TaxID=512399 RepID=A0A1C0ZUI5_9BACL|nr:response regulator [Paenibacillus pectinilyticus]OCT11765.1 hypothetical protein A8709_28240 [Paenibacillus pectinilyticus]